MEQYGWIGIVGALASLIWYLVYHHSSNSSSTKIRSVCNPKSEDLEPITSTPPTRALLLFVLRKLNFDYELDQDGDILLKYQGEYLQMLASDNRKYILIQDLWWHSAPLDDIENLSILHRAVNECNFENATNIIAYTQDVDENTINIYTFRNLFLIPEIPEIEVYFKATLEAVLLMHQRFYNKMESIRREKHVEANS